MRGYLLVSGVIFVVAGVLHLLRFVRRVGIFPADRVFVLSTAVIAVAAFAMAAWSFRLLLKTPPTT